MIRCSFKPSKVIHFCDLQTWMHKAESMRWKTAPLFVRPHNVPKICCLWGKKIRTPSPRHVSQLQSILEIPAITVQGFLKIQDFQVIWKKTPPPIPIDQSFMNRWYGFVFFGDDQLQARLGSSTAKQTTETYPETDPQKTDPWGKLPGTSFWDIPISLLKKISRFCNESSRLTTLERSAETSMVLGRLKQVPTCFPSQKMLVEIQHGPLAVLNWVVTPISRVI